jgi:excisionase family DNA binding protein
MTQKKLTTDDAAKYLGVDPSWLYRLRADGSGPRFFKFGRVIRYDVADLDAWTEAHKQVALPKGEPDAGRK